MTTERDYVLGTHDDEVARLALQHRLWRPRALDAWQRAGFGPGQTLIDVGCGPGAATLDLAEIVGPRGRVVAIDRSRRFLDRVESLRDRDGLGRVDTFELDLDAAPLPEVAADGAWVRWVFAFVRNPRDLAARVREALRPGGVLVLHEYFHYATWRFAPRSPEHEEFVASVMTSWRASGGEPDVGLDLPHWLAELGFRIESLRPIVEIISPADPLWEWPKVFMDVGLRRLVELGQLTPERAAEMTRAFALREADPHTRMITPAVVEVIARRS